MGTKYNGSKDVNYCTIYYRMENPVGDPAEEDITHQDEFTQKYVGPIVTGDWLTDMSTELDPKAYCSACSKLIIDSILLEYADGTKEMVDYGWYTEMIHDCDEDDLIEYMAKGEDEPMIEYREFLNSRKNG